MPISAGREESEGAEGAMARGECTAAWSCAMGGLVRRTWVTVAGRIGARRHDSRDGRRGAVPTTRPAAGGPGATRRYRWSTASDPTPAFRCGCDAVTGAPRDD